MAELDYGKFLQEQTTSENDPFNYDQFRQSVGDAAASTRDVGGTEGYGAIQDLYNQTKSLGTTAKQKEKLLFLRLPGIFQLWRGKQVKLRKDWRQWVLGWSPI